MPDTFKVLPVAMLLNDVVLDRGDATFEEFIAKELSRVVEDEFGCTVDNGSDDMEGDEDADIIGVELEALNVIMS